jgi:hypothetical protein
VAELDREHGGLERIQPGVDAPEHVLVPPGLAHVAQPAHALGDVGVVRHHHAAVAVGSEVLAGIEAEAADTAEAATRLPEESRAVRLGGVLHLGEAVRPMPITRRKS